MKYPSYVCEEVKLQENITKEKNKLKNNLEIYRKFLLNENSLSEKKLTVDDINGMLKLYGTIIGLLFKNFYGLNSTDLVKYFRKIEKVSVPGSDIIYMMNDTHLNYYLDMVSDTNYCLDNYPTLTVEELVKNVVAISTRKCDIFSEENDSNPFDNLVKIVRTQEEKKNSLKNNQMTLEGFTRKR